MGTLLKKLTTLVKGSFAEMASLPLEDTDEKNIKNESDAHKDVLAKNKTLLQNPKYGSRNKDEKNQVISR